MLTQYLGKVLSVPRRRGSAYLMGWIPNRVLNRLWCSLHTPLLAVVLIMLLPVRLTNRFRHPETSTPQDLGLARFGATRTHTHRARIPMEHAYPWSTGTRRRVARRHLLSINGNAGERLEEAMKGW
jgi:hypothetical protein